MRQFCAPPPYLWDAPADFFAPPRTGRLLYVFLRFVFTKLPPDVLLAGRFFRAGSGGGASGASSPPLERQSAADSSDAFAAGRRRAAAGFADAARAAATAALRASARSRPVVGRSEAFGDAEASAAVSFSATAAADEAAREGSRFRLTPAAVDGRRVARFESPISKSSASFATSKSESPSESPSDAPASLAAVRSRRFASAASRRLFAAAAARASAASRSSSGSGAGAGAVAGAVAAASVASSRSASSIAASISSSSGSSARRALFAFVFVFVFVFPVAYVGAGGGFGFALGRLGDAGITTGIFAGAAVASVSRKSLSVVSRGAFELGFGSSPLPAARAGSARATRTSAISAPRASHRSGSNVRSAFAAATDEGSSRANEADAGAAAPRPNGFATLALDGRWASLTLGGSASEGAASSGDFGVAGAGRTRGFGGGEAHADAGRAGGAAAAAAGDGRAGDLARRSGWTRVAAAALTGVASTTSSSSSSSLLSSAAGRRRVIADGRVGFAAAGFAAWFARAPREASRNGVARRATRAGAGFASARAVARCSPERAFSFSTIAFRDRYSPYISRTPGAARASSWFGWRPCARWKSLSHVLSRTRTRAIRADASSPPPPDVDAGASTPAADPRGASVASISAASRREAGTMTRVGGSDAQVTKV